MIKKKLKKNKKKRKAELIELTTCIVMNII